MGLESANHGHIGVRNYGTNPSTGFNFMLRVEGIWDIPCRSVRGFTKENEYELIQEGGVNDYVHMRRKQITKPLSFQVERYVGTEILDPLTLGTDLVLPVLLIVFRGSAYGGGLMSRTYVFTGCTVMAKEYGSLDAEKSELMLETTTIGYRELLVLDNPLSVTNVNEPWKITENSKKGGETGAGQSAKKNPKGEEALKSTWETTAKQHQWYLDKDHKTKTGGGKQSAAATVKDAKGKDINSTEAAKSTWEGKASNALWKFDKTAKAGKGKRSAVNGIKDAEGNSLYPESAKSELEKIAAEHLWGFEQQKKAGQGKLSAAKTVAVDGKKLTKAETSKKVLEGKAKEWEFNKQIKDGNKIQSAANVTIKETGQKSLEGKSVLWEFSGKNAAGNGKQSANSVAKFLASKK